MMGHECEDHMVSVDDAKMAGESQQQGQGQGQGEKQGQ